MLDDICINGITSIDSYPTLISKKFCKEGIINNIVYLPSNKPDIESINEVTVNISANDLKIIETILGPKMLIYGCINIKIIYTADNCQQSLHSSHWKVPFFDFTLLKGLIYEDCIGLVCNNFIGTENIYVKCFNKRSVDVSILYIVCPQLNPCRVKKEYLNDDYLDCKENYNNNKFR